MNARRIIAAVVSTVALIAVNVGIADSASAKTSSWHVTGPDSKQSSTSSWD